MACRRAPFGWLPSSTALFDALLAAYPALPDKPSRLATLMIAPRLWRSICGMTARQQSSVLRTLMLKRKFQSARSASCTGLPPR